MEEENKNRNRQPSSSSDETPMEITEDMLAKPKRKKRRSKISHFERGMSYFPFITLAIIVANVVVYILEVSHGSLMNARTIINAGALYRWGVMNGEIWRLVTCIFLHGSFGHLFGNCIMLYIFGMACEHGVGYKQMINVYFVSGICGSLLSAFCSVGPSVGASGAIFGVSSAVVMFFYKYDLLYNDRNKQIGVVLFAWAIYSIFNGLTVPYIANFAHIGGFLGGLYMGKNLKKKEEYDAV